MKKVLFFVVTVLICNVTYSFGQSSIITTVAGSGISGYSGDGGPATLAQIDFCHRAIAVDVSGNLYLTDPARIRKVTTSGMITTIAGTGITGFSGDGGPATAANIDDDCSWGLVVDPIGNIYFVDGSYRIRKVDPSGIISTIAGISTFSYNGDGIPATAAAFGAMGLALDASGNLYVADGGNSRIRKIDISSGMITTIAGIGMGGCNGDGGPATAAMVGGLNSLVLDNTGNIYFGCGDNTIRKIDASGIISTIAGTYLRGYGGDGGPATAATFMEPFGISVDGAGNIYFADEENHRIRKIDASGIITTVVGNGIRGYGGDGGAPISAQINDPDYTVFDGSGNMYINDKTNAVIRKITPGALIVPSTANNSFKLQPNPAIDQIAILNEKDARLILSDLIGKQLIDHLISSEKETLYIGDLAKGVYLGTLIEPLTGQKKTTRFVKE